MVKFCNSELPTLVQPLKGTEFQEMLERKAIVETDEKYL